MKNLFFIISLLFISFCSFSQNNFDIFSERANEKTFKGVISREALEKDTSFHWFTENQKGYKPNKDAVEGLKNNKDSIHLITFMGTWCHDSHDIIPKFYSLLDTAGFSNNNVTLIGVDRKKKTFSDLTGALNVTNVPTIIVMKNGKEIGRVVEYGKFGLFDMELGSILKNMNK
jgi:thiol-disulfide isomerase/thioredoxin